jgi:ankyrin repeat protein
MDKKTLLSITALVALSTTPLSFSMNDNSDSKKDGLKENIKPVEEKKVDVNKVINELGMTKLILACATQNATEVKTLLQEKDIDVNRTIPNNGWTALHLACYNGDLSIVRLLLQKKDINVNPVNNRGDTPLRIVCNQIYLDIPSQEDLEIKKELEKRGAKLN